MMTEDQLRVLGLKYGDQLALRSFARATLVDSNSAANNLFGRLEDKLSGHGNMRKKQKLCGNQNAKKSERTLEIGWLNLESGEYRQVKAKRGGGTRNEKLPVTTTGHQILQVAYDLFFPNGVSAQLGRLVAYDTFLTNFDKVPLDPDCTLGEIYEKTKVGKLRVYMTTSIKEEVCWHCLMSAATKRFHETGILR